LAGVRQFSKWLAAEGEIPSDPLVGVNAPKAPVPLTPCLDEGELKALVSACRGPSLRDRRDEALIRLMAECGLRALLWFTTLGVVSAWAGALRVRVLVAVVVVVDMRFS